MESLFLVSCLDIVFVIDDFVIIFCKEEKKKERVILG